MVWLPFQKHSTLSIFWENIYFLFWFWLKCKITEPNGKKKTWLKCYTIQDQNAFLLIFQAIAQDYEVAEIECSFGEMNVDSSQRINQRLTAKLKKPEGFKGSPIFADERKVDPENHPECQIRPDETDPKGIGYLLKITDLTQCGVLIKNVSLQLWCELKWCDGKMSKNFNFWKHLLY